MNPVLFYKDLADDTRLKILLLIFSEKELCVCELTQALELSQPKVSRHLSQLRNNGLLTDRRSGKWVYYSLSKKIPHWQLHIIETTFQYNHYYLANAQQLLTSLGNASDRQQQCC